MSTKASATPRWATMRYLLLATAALCAVETISAQLLDVDVTPNHARKSFIPSQTLGAGIDRIPIAVIDAAFSKPTVDRVLEAGWQPVSYRQNTELYTEAWHWNPAGTWSDPSGKGYFTGNATPTDAIRYSFGYPLPHRGVTRDDGTETIGYSRLTDGDLNTYWKSNPYLTSSFTGEDDSLHPQWVFLDLATAQLINAIRIAWADPYARQYRVQYWTGDDPIRLPTKGIWQTFPFGSVADGKGGTATIKLSSTAMAVRWIRIVMTESSNTCDSHGSGDRRNCVGYAIREVFVGALDAQQQFHDLLRHTPDQDQTATYCSSVDPWHEPADIDRSMRAQVGFDLFYTSGYTRGLPAMIPIAMIYGTPEDAAAEITYLKKRNYPISYIEMGEEPDGHYTPPEDYAALYIQFAAALHKVDTQLKLGGPIFTGENKDIETWADAQGRTSWTVRFLDYLKSHGRLSDLAFFSFEHYPFEPCKIQWSSLYDEPGLISNILQVWRDDGVPPGVPMFITESNIASETSENSVDIFAALWLADYVGAFLTAGGDAIYYFHYIPMGVRPGCNKSGGSFGLFTVNSSFQLQQPVAQFFASQLINLEWVKPGNELHRIFPVASDIQDGLGHILVKAYAVQRPQGDWALLVINKDQESEHPVRVQFHNADSRVKTYFSGRVQTITFGRAQYQWHPVEKLADPDGPPVRAEINADANTVFDLPAASIVVLRGKLGTMR